MEEKRRERGGGGRGRGRRERIRREKLHAPRKNMKTKRIGQDADPFPLLSGTYIFIGVGRSQREREREKKNKFGETIRPLSLETYVDIQSRDLWWKQCLQFSILNFSLSFLVFAGFRALVD